MNKSIQAGLTSDGQLTEVVSKIEAGLVKIKAEMTTLENRLNQTRGEYWRVMRHLAEVKSQLQTSTPNTVVPYSFAEEVDLEIYEDADWEHLMKQINNL